MPTIPYPNVPNVPGVPPIARAPGRSVLAAVSLGALQGALWRATQIESQWGIWDKSGNPVGDPSTITGLARQVLESLGIGSVLSTNAVEYSKETRVSEFPLERGSFASYNKVEMSASPTVTLCLKGSESDRTSFLAAIDAATKSTELFDVVTPEVTYVDYSIERYNYSRRISKGTTLLIVEISLREVRQVSAQYTTTQSGQVDAPKDAGAAPTADSGKVQGAAPRQSVAKSIATKLGI